MTRRCLICAALNPCTIHTEADQRAELARNDAAIARIRSGPAMTPASLIAAQTKDHPHD